MTYTWAAAVAVVLAVAADLLLLRTALVRRRVFWVSYAIVLAFQFAVNGVLTGVGVVRYDPDVILGMRLAWAPIEDVGFGFALVTLTLSGWMWLERHRVGAPGPTDVAR